MSDYTDLPSWITVDSTTGMISILAASSPGSYYVLVFGVAQNFQYNFQPFNLVSNQPPAFTSTLADQIVHNKLLSFMSLPGTTDLDHDTVTVAISSSPSSPSWVSLSSQSEIKFDKPPLTDYNSH